jgi:hypothetical protein
MSLSLFFTIAFSVGVVFFWWFVLENILGRMTRRTKWKDMTTGQWIFFIGSFLWPIGMIGLLMINRG